MQGRGPVIYMRAAQTKNVVDQAENALVKASEAPEDQLNRIFQRAQELVRITRIDDVKDERGVRRKAGAMVITRVDPAWLTERLDDVADWRAFRDDNWKPTTPRRQFVDTLIRRRAWRFPVLRGISTTPTLAADGRIVQEPGFDEGTGLFLDFKPGDFPAVSENPSLEDAKAALKVFANPLRAMPWAPRGGETAERNAARSVALSAGLTALVRSSLRTAPLHAFDAPSRGSGKSLCCEWVGIIKLGQAPPAMNQGKNAEEDEKRIGASLRAGDQVVLIDNCVLPLEGDALCSALTQEQVSIRILGESEKLTLPTNVTFLSSGNNLATRGDMTRRVVICRLDAQVERPEERSFDFDLKRETLQRRPQIVVAGLTILKAYIAAGRPQKGKLTPLGGFEDWTWIREALVWLGEADPCNSRSQLIESDTELSELVEVMDAWEAAIGPQTIALGKISQDTKAGYKLLAKLGEVTNSYEFNARRAGCWLRRFKDRVVGKRSFREAGTHAGVVLWKLEGAKSPTNDKGTQMPVDY